MAGNVAKKVTVTVELRGLAGGLNQQIDAAKQKASQLQKQVGGGAVATSQARAVAQTAKAALSAQDVFADELQKSQKKLLEDRAKNQIGTTAEGRRDIAERIRLTRELSRQEDWLNRVAQHGRVGAGLGLAAEKIAPFAQSARNIGFLGAGLAVGAVAAGSPQSAQHLSNSAQVLAGEIGTSFIPEIARISHWLQQAGDSVRDMDRETKRVTGSLLFWGSVILGGGGAGLAALGTGVNAYLGLRQGYQWLTGGRAAASVATNAPGGAMPSAYNFGGAAGSQSGWATLLNRVVPAVAVAYAVYDRGNAAYQTYQNPDIAGREAFNTTTSYTSNVGSLMAGQALGIARSVARWALPEQFAQVQAAVTDRQQPWIVRTLGQLIYGDPEDEAARRRRRSELLIDRNPQIGAVESPFFTTAMANYQGTARQREIEIRGLEELSTNVERLNGNFETRLPRQDG
jgi:hypothetical protein